MTPLEHAISQLGVAEATGHNDGIPFTRYQTTAREPGPWCAAFVAWCFARSGRPLPGRAFMLPNVEYMESNLQLKGAWWSVTALTEKPPIPGDLVFFNWRVDSDEARSVRGGRHVEILEDLRLGPTTLVTIGGNVRNAVRRNERTLAGVTGFARWPVDFPDTTYSKIREGG